MNIMEIEGIVITLSAEQESIYKQLYREITERATLPCFIVDRLIWKMIRGDK